MEQPYSIRGLNRFLLFLARSTTSTLYYLFLLSRAGFGVPVSYELKNWWMDSNSVCK